jgi:hypothetical protein
MVNKAEMGCPAYSGGNGCIGVDSPGEDVSRMRNRTEASICDYNADENMIGPERDDENLRP